MKSLGYNILLPEDIQSPIISSFEYPDENFSFKDFYTKLKEQGFVIYPGKISGDGYIQNRLYRPNISNRYEETNRSDIIIITTIYVTGFKE